MRNVLFYIAGAATVGAFFYIMVRGSSTKSEKRK